MRRRQTYRRRTFANAVRTANRSQDWCRTPCVSTSSSMLYIRRGRPAAARARRDIGRPQAGSMAKSERRRKPARFPKEIELAIRAAEDKKAQDITVLDLRNASGFTDHFLICSGANA